MKRDPRAAFAKHNNIVSIDCHIDAGDCLLTSRLSFKDVAKSPEDLSRLRRTLGQQRRDDLSDDDGADDEDTAGLFLPNAEDLYSSAGFKTYHDLEDHPSAGYQHNIIWDLKVRS